MYRAMLYCTSGRLADNDWGNEGTNLGLGWTKNPREASIHSVIRSKICCQRLYLNRYQFLMWGM